MNNINFEEEMLFEHRFWLQILGDHARFIYDALSPSEVEKIQKAAYFIRVFDELLGIARQPLSEGELYELTRNAHLYAQEIRKFKLEIIQEHIVGQIKIELPPTFINHMVNEVEEYIRILQRTTSKEKSVLHPLHHHKLWLPDAAGHAGAIKCSLDDVEKELKKKSKEFVKDFEGLYLKADEFTGYLRTGVNEFPALDRLNNQVEVKIQLFMKFLKEIQEFRLSKKALGTLMPLIADHMFREECYYLIKLSRVSEVKAPDCDPTRKRI